MTIPSVLSFCTIFWLAFTVDVRTTASVISIVQDLREVYCVEPDLYSNNNPNLLGSNLLVCSGNALLTVSPEDGDIIEVAGLEQQEGYQEGDGTAARFDTVTAVLQYDPNNPIIIDHGNHCLRQVNRATGLTTRYSGFCETSGSSNGYRTTARFFQPYRGIVNGDKIYLVEFIDQGGLRSIDLATGFVSRLGTAPILTDLSDIVYHSPTNSLLMTAGHAVVKHNLDSQLTIVMAGIVSFPGDRDGSVLQNNFNEPRAICLISDGLALIADRKNGKLKLFDLGEHTVTTIVNGVLEIMTVNSVEGDIFVGQRLEGSSLLRLVNGIPPPTTTSSAAPKTSPIASTLTQRKTIPVHTTTPTTPPTTSPTTTPTTIPTTTPTTTPINTPTTPPTTTPEIVPTITQTTASTTPTTTASTTQTTTTSTSNDTPATETTSVSIPPTLPAQNVVSNGGLDSASIIGIGMGSGALVLILLMAGIGLGCYLKMNRERARAGHRRPSLSNLPYYNSENNSNTINQRKEAGIRESGIYDKIEDTDNQYEKIDYYQIASTSQVDSDPYLEPSPAPNPQNNESEINASGIYLMPYPSTSAPVPTSERQLPITPEQ